MGWLQLVGSIKLQVSFAEYSLFYRALLQKRPIIFSILLTQATPYVTYEEAMSHESLHIWRSQLTWVMSHCEWVMSHVNEACHTWMRYVDILVYSSIMSHVTHVVSHMQKPRHMSHVTYEEAMWHESCHTVNESCHIKIDILVYSSIMSHVIQVVSHMKKPRHMSHVTLWMSHVTCEWDTSP